MQLRSDLSFLGSKTPKLELTIPEGDADDKLTLGLKAEFTKAIADELGVGWMFSGETTANPGLKNGHLSQDIQFTDVELQLTGDHGGLDTFYPEKVYGFFCYTTSGAGWGVSCKIDINGHLTDILDFFRQHRSDGFTFTIRSRQKGLFEGGTQVEMGADQEPSDPPETVDIVAETLADRSHENAPKRKRGRPARVISANPPKVDGSEWDEHFNKLHAVAAEEGMAVQLETEEPVIQ